MNSLTSCVFACLVFAGTASGQMTSRVSVGSGGTEGDDYSTDLAISGNGRYVVFFSLASNLVPNDTNGQRDIFVRDRVKRTTARVSVDSYGVEANGSSFTPAISADGRFVAFASDARNLVPGDTNFARDIFVHDRVTGTTSRVSVDSNGAESDNVSYQPKLSSDGRFVAFASDAANLVAGDLNASRDVFVHDRVNGLTTRVSLSAAGVELPGASIAPAISADGTTVAFESSAQLVPADTNGAFDIYVRDLASHSTICANANLAGVPEGIFTPGDVAISGNGLFVGFSSSSPNLVAGDLNNMPDIFVRDLAAGTTKLVSVDSNRAQGSWISSYVSISYSGRYIAFGSFAPDLVPNDANGSTKDIFLRDVGAATTTLVSVNSLGAQSNGHSTQPTISLDGKHVAFHSDATNLAHGDTNGAEDVFVRDLP